MDFSQNSSRSISYVASSWNQIGGGSWNGQDQDFFSLSRAGSAAAAIEEEALRRAAIEKLPTYDRLRTGIMRKALSCCDVDEETQQYSRCQVVDVMSMCSEERHEFIERILKKGDHDNEMFLRKLRNRIDKAGVKLPTVEVRFENLTVEAKCHVGSRALPTLLNEAKNVAESILGLLGISLTRKTNLNILKDVSGIIRPSRMTLLLGPPSSGKTTLLRSLAGKLDPSLEMGGEVTYNGYKLCEFVPQKTAAYISQNDIHTGEMTVKETLDFSARCQGVGDRYELLSELARREKALGIVPEPEVDLFMKATSIGGAKNSLQTDYTLSILGLDICANTVVGGEMRRGISGGQMKRVTTGEMIVGPTKTLFMDEISTGLDSSTTHHVVKCLQQIVHLGEATILMSLLQPAPETFELFDDIILLAEGLIIYQGPLNYVLEFFKSSGFQCPERKGIADFLQEVISRKDQEQYWADKSRPYQFISPTEFVRCFKRFHVGRNLYNMLSIPFDKSKSHGAALVLTKQSVPLKEILNASFAKEWLLIKRNSFVYVFRTIQLFIVALITSTFFLRTSMHARTEADGVMYLGALLFGLVVNMFNGFAELHLAILRLPVFYKQRDLLFYPTWVFTLPNCIIRIPISFLESAVWVTLTYYAIGFAPEACRFFKQLLIFFLVQQTAAGLFRLVAGLTRSTPAANTSGCLLILLLFALGGFILPKALIPNWWTWGYWLSPLTHSFTALAINEMFSSKWMNKFAPDGRKLGVAVLENMNIFTEKSWYWKSVGILFGYSILFNVLFTLSLMYLHPLGKPTPVISEETAMEMQTSQIEAMEYSAIRRALSLENIVSRSLSVDNGNNKSEMLFQCRNDCANNISPEWRSLETYKNESNITAPRKGMALPFIPLAMSFNDVSYYVDMPPEMKEQGVTEERLQLLREISGAFRPGILTALMGVSGAGKTTLMDVLAGRKTGGYINGDIKISGYPKKQATFVRVSGYCEQLDIHSPQLTVKESLLFSAFLRLVNEVSGEEKTRFVDEVMELVELHNLKDALVGLAGVTGLSTEQRKRLTIAVELVANPSIIYMDEPTSGLDARAAAIVMRTVRNTVDTGRTVVCTIHQPSIDIFKTFDELLLLKRGGQIIYSGSLGQNCQKLVEYFEAIPGVLKIKDGLNPAVWMLEASSVATEASLGINFAEIYKSSSLHKRNKALIRELAKPLPGSSDIFFPTQYPQSRVRQLKICLWKHWTIYWRSPEYNFFRLGMTLIIALLLGSIFWKIGQHRDDSANLTSVIGAMYLAVLFVGFGNCATVQPLVATERLVFYREKAAGMYSALPYALSQVIVELPYVLFQALYYTLIIYSMMNFQWTTIKFLWFFLISFLSFLYFTYYGMMTVAVSPNIQVAGILSASFFFLFNLFSGIFLPRPQIPKWWTWYYWFCPVAWTLYGLIVTQYGDMYDMIKVPGQADQQIRDYVINHFGYRDDYLGLIIAVLFGFPIIFAIIYIFCIKYMNFQQR